MDKITLAKIKNITNLFKINGYNNYANDMQKIASEFDLVNLPGELNRDFDQYELDNIKSMPIQDAENALSNINYDQTSISWDKKNLLMLEFYSNPEQYGPMIEVINKFIKSPFDQPAEDVQKAVFFFRKLADYLEDTFEYSLRFQE